LVLTGALGATAQYFGLDPNLVVISTAAGTAAPPMLQAALSLKHLHGPARWRRIGSHLIFPPLVVGGGAYLGVLAGEHALAPGSDPQSAPSLAKTFFRSIIMGGDEPAILMMALPRRQKSRRPQPVQSQ
jgi:hypothetical protein